MKFRKALIFSILFALGISTRGQASELATLYDSIKHYYKVNDFESVKTTGENALELAKQQDDKHYLAKTYYLLAFIYAKNDDFGTSIIYYLEGARFAELSSDPDIKKDLISIYKNLSNILGDYKHYDLAHKFINEALRVAQEQNSKEQIPSLINNRIHELLSDERYEDALIELNNLSSEYDLSPGRLISVFNKFGIAYHNLGLNEQAIESYKTVINQNPTIDPEVYSMSLLNLGNIYLEMGNVAEALDYYDKTIVFGQAHELNIRTIRGLQKKGEAFSSLEKYPDAIDNFHRGIELMETGRETPNSHEIYKQLSTAYTAIGEFESALRYERIYSVKLEEFIQQQKEIEELDKKYNIQLLTERYFDLLAADHEKKETERLAKFGIGGTTVIFLSILFLILYKQQRTKISLARELSQIELNSEV